MGPSDGMGSASQKIIGSKKSYRQRQLLPHLAYPDALAVPPWEIMGQSKNYRKQQQQQLLLLLQWAHPGASGAAPRNIIGLNEAIRNRNCRWDGAHSGASGAPLRKIIGQSEAIGS
jgi:hypothetical protein